MRLRHPKINAAEVFIGRFTRNPFIFLARDYVFRKNRLSLLYVYIARRLHIIQEGDSRLAYSVSTFS